MRRYSDKLFRGENPSSQDWEEQLKETHKGAPSMTPSAFSDYETSSGKNSYGTLVAALSNVESQTPRILDLACGDGFMIRYILAEKPNAQVTGIDMAKSGLEIARARGYGDTVNFRCETADQISVPDGYYDAVLCHMAVMLISPIEPEFAEIKRVLKPQGVFAAVVSGEVLQPDTFFESYQKRVGGFLKAKYPNFGTVFSGDPRVRKRDGILEIFREAKFAEPTITDFELDINTKPENLRSLFENMYVIAMVPSTHREELMQKIISAAEAHSGHKNISFGFPLRLIESKRI